VTIVETAKLTDKDKRDFNNSYVEVYLDENKKQKTRTINNQERPIWNQTFDLQVIIYFLFIYIFKYIYSDLSSNNNYLHVHVYDEGKKADLIGSTKISLDKIIKKGYFDDWVELLSRLGFGSRGDIHIRITVEKTSSL